MKVSGSLTLATKEANDGVSEASKRSSKVNTGNVWTAMQLLKTRRIVSILLSFNVELRLIRGAVKRDLQKKWGFFPIFINSRSSLVILLIGLNYIPVDKGSRRRVA